MGDNKPVDKLHGVVAWSAHPFSSDMPALDWVLWLGLIIATAIAWTRLIHHFID